MASYAVRPSPLQTEVTWTVDKAQIVERRGRRERRFPLTELRGVTRARQGAVLKFRRRKLTIPARSYGEDAHIPERAQAFDAFLAAIDAAAPGRTLAASPYVEAALWIMALMGVGALAVLLASGLAGAWLLGLALASRLLFVVILGAAVLPWLPARRKARGTSPSPDEHELS
jgi:hypothetical protein